MANAFRVGISVGGKLLEGDELPEVPELAKGEGPDDFRPVVRLLAWATENRRSLLTFAVVLALIFLLRMPAHYEISIDDINKFGSSDPYGKLIDGAARWNRWMTVSLAFLFQISAVPFGAFMFSGSVLADALLVVFCFVLCRFFDRGASTLVIVSVASVIALAPQIFVLVHFHLIGYSLAATYAALIWLLLAADSQRRWALPVAITLGGAVVAGSYQSGLYWYALCVLGISLRDGLRGAKPLAVVQNMAIHGVYMAVGLAIYAVLGKLLSIGIAPPKHQFATFQEMLDMAEARLSSAYFNWHLRDLNNFPKVLKLLVLYHAAALLSFSFMLARKKRGYGIVVIVFCIAVLLCAVQILMFPYNYQHVPVRSFWWFGLMYALVFLLFHTAFQERRENRNAIHITKVRDQASGIFYSANLGVVILFGLCFAVSTYRLGDGLTKLRATDDIRAEVILENLKSLDFQNDKPIVLALGDKKRLDAMHAETIGATKTMFWANWTRVPFLNTKSDMVFREAPVDLFNEGRQSCLENAPVGPMPRVTIETDYVLVCL